jgi:hypothetical protein
LLLWTLGKWEGKLFSALEGSVGRALTLVAPVVLHYLKAPTAVKLTGVCFIAF